MAGGKGGGSAPAAPDPAATAAAQGAVNKETAIAQANMNRINQVTPYGSLTYNQIGTNSDNTPQYQATTTLSPQQQAMLNETQTAGQKTGQIANQQLQRLQQTLSTPVSYDKAPALNSSIDPNSQVYKDAESAYLSRMQPQLAQRRAQTEQQLANQGIAPGTQAYDNAMRSINQGENDANQQAIMAGYQLAGQNANLGNQARQQYIQEAASIRNQPLNEISALLSGTQVQNPQFTNTPQVNIQPADYQGAANLQYQSQLANWQNEQQQSQAMMGGLFGLGGSALMAGLMPGGFLLK